MNNKVELNRFPDFESASEVISILEDNNFEYKTEEKKNGQNTGMASGITSGQVVILVRDADYNSIIKLERIKEILTNDAPEHYLYTFSDEDIVDAIKNPHEYSADELKIAEHIAAERGLKTKEDIEGDKSGYPPKPIEETKKQSLNQSLISMGLFVAAFHLIFNWEITYILVLAGVILIHEIGHFLAMRFFKYNDLAIFFVPLIGAFTSGQKNTISQKQDVIILLSGPIPGIIIGLIFYYYGLQESNEFLLRVSNIFIFLNLFNLIPIMPLDGGRIIKSMFFENKEIIRKIFIFISIALLTYISITTQSYFLLIIPFFLFIQQNSQTQIRKVKKAAVSKGVNLDKSYNELTDEEYWLIRDEIGTHIKYFERFITPKRYVASDNENKVIKQVKSIIQKKPIKDLKIFGKILFTLLWVLTLIVPLIVILD